MVKKFINIFQISELQKENKRLHKALDKACKTLVPAAETCPKPFNTLCEKCKYESCEECWKEWLLKDD